MALARSDTIAVAKGRDFQSLPLTPEDFFVLSRIQGDSTVGEAIAASGLDAASAEKIIHRLYELGVLESKVQPTAGAPKRDDAMQRKKRRLVAQLRDTGKVPTLDKSDAPPAAPEPKPGPTAPKEPEIRSLLDFVDPVSPDDPRIDTKRSMPLEDQRRLLAVQDRVEKFSHFDILGIAPTQDTKVIRRGYHHASRKLHPDAFYGQDLGPFQIILDDLFKRAKSSYEVLMNDRARSDYLERLLAARRRQEEAQRKILEVEERQQAALQAVERQRIDERQRAQREHEALANEAARRERAERDSLRRRRQTGRMVGLDRRKTRALEHEAQGRKEIESARFGAAAGFFRLALDLDPQNEELHRLWQQSLDQARVRRAENAVSQGQRYAQLGQNAESAHFFAEAADAQPTPQNLGEAASAMAVIDAGRAREYAVAALDALVAARKSGDSNGQVTDKQASRIHLGCARAFLAAGQNATARSQAKLAVERNPANREAKSLLNSIKVT